MASVYKNSNVLTNRSQDMSPKCSAWNGFMPHLSKSLNLKKVGGGMGCGGVGLGCGGVVWFRQVLRFSSESSFNSFQ